MRPLSGCLGNIPVCLHFLHDVFWRIIVLNFEGNPIFNVFYCSCVTRGQRHTLLCFIPEALEFQLTFTSFILILERTYSVFHQNYDVNYRWLIRLRKFPSILTWVRVTVNGCWILSNAHFVSVEIIMCFLFLILIWSITLIDLWMLSQPSIPGMNLLRVYNLLYILLDLIHSYFVRNFILVFTSDIGL